MDVANLFARGDADEEDDDDVDVYDGNDPDEAYAMEEGFGPPPLDAPPAGPPPAMWEPVPVLRRIWHVDPPGYAEADDDWCFMCEVGEEGHDNPFYRMLVDHINKTSGLVSDEALCQDVQDIYNRELRPHQVVPRDWSKRSIMRHIEEHSMNPVLMMRRTLRVINEELRVMEEGMLRERSPGLPDRVNIKIMPHYLKLVEARSKLIREMAHAGSKQK